MSDIVTICFEVIFGVYLLNFVIDVLFGIDIIGIIVKKIRTWAEDYDDPD